MQSLLKMAGAIDRLTARTGRIVSTLILALMFTMVYEVAARYFFNAPTSWSYDLSYMIGSSMMLLGAGYAVMHDAHVRVDLLYERWSRKTKSLVDTILMCVFFFPFVGIFTQRSFQSAFTAFERGTRSDYGIWMPLTWPFKLAIAIGFLLMLLAGISWLVKCVAGLKGIEVAKLEEEE